MIEPSNVSAVLVTKGDVDLTQIIDSITGVGIDDIIVWNNAERDQDLSCFGRYAGIEEARNEIIYHQDDDLVAPVAAILDAYRPVEDRWAIVANNRPDEEWPLTAMGVLFHRDLANCFDGYADLYGFDADFCRVSDVIFAYQHPYRRIWVGYQDLPWQIWPDRMHLQADHYYVRERARLRTLALPDKVPV